MKNACSKNLFAACKVLFASAILSLLMPANSIAGETLYGKTFIVTYQVVGRSVPFRFYISGQGVLYAYNNYGKRCSSTGTSAKINGGNSESSFTCTDGTVSRTTANAQLVGDTVSLDENQTSTSRSGISGSARSQTSFSSDGKTCKPVSYRQDGESFTPISCQVKAGR